MLISGYLGQTAAQSQILLGDTNQTNCVIICSKDADQHTVDAAMALQSLLWSAGVYDAEISSDPVEGFVNIYFGKKWLPVGKRQKLDSAVMEDAFMILATGDGVWLAGKNPIGDRYAVYTLFEEYLGFMWFTPEETLFVKHGVVAIPQIDRLYVPAFPFRVPGFPGRFDREFATKHKISNFDQWGPLWVHTFHRLIPPEEYFDKHPEYFALVDGRRLKDGQLCLGNPEVISLLTGNLGNAMAEKPDAIYWSVSQNDCYNYCECELCRKMYDQYGSYSGAYVWMANQIATAFPDKQISTLAYQFTRSAPTGIKPLPNVNIMFCSIECNRSMPIAEDHRSTGFVRDMQEWAAITENIFMWDYVVQFSNYVCPFPNLHVLKPNILFFRDNGAKMMFQQGSGRSWSDLMELKQYVIAKLLWNPDIDVDSCIRRFVDNYYFEAAPFIQRYIDFTHQALIKVQETQNLDIYGFPVFYTNAHLSPAMLLLLEQQMNLAEIAVGHDPVLLERVQRTRLSVDFALIDVALNTNDPLLPWVIYDDDVPEINPDMIKRLELFRDLCAFTGITAINERKLTPDDYVAFVLEKTKRMIDLNVPNGDGNK